MSYVYVFATLFLTVYGQIVIKWRVIEAGAFPSTTQERLQFILQLLINPWVLSSFVAAFMAALSWMVAMTKLDLSHAYPFMSLAFVLVLFLSSIFFNESITVLKLIGVLIVIVGISIGVNG